MISRKKSDSGLVERRVEEFDELLRFDENSPPVEPVDELRKRRNIEAALDRLEAVERSRASSGSRGEAAGKPRVRGTLIAACLAAAAAAALVAVWPWAPEQTAGPGKSGPETNGAVVAKAPVSLPVKVLMVTGEGRRLADRLLSQEELIAGEVAATFEGRAVIGFADKAKALLGPHTSLKLGEADETSVDMFLESGDVLVSVVPGDGQTKVAVSTSQGRVVVKGTVFSVKTDGKEVDVAVYRGAVQVEDTGLPLYTIRASQTARMSDGYISPLTNEQEMAGLTRERSMDVLGSSDLAFLEVQSIPAGARVTLDGMSLGDAPVVAAVRPGYRELGLELAGHSAVTEHIALSSNKTLSRVFEMEPMEIGESASRHSGSRTKEKASVTVSPADLMVEAQNQRKQRRWAQAAETLERIIETYPGSPEAHTARVSLGMIQLKQLNRQRKALANFDEYLSISSTGTLAQEASWGRALCYRSVGDAEKEREALKMFLSRYPGSIWAVEAKSRLADLTTSTGH